MLLFEVEFFCAPFINMLEKANLSLGDVLEDNEAIGFVSASTIV